MLYTICVFEFFFVYCFHVLFFGFPALEKEFTETGRRHVVLFVDPFKVFKYIYVYILVLVALKYFNST